MEILESVLVRFPRIWAAYLTWNFCKGELADGSPKPESLAFMAFRKIFYLDCACCAAVRGILAGLVLGFAFGVLACLI
jgi:hypothetical protein